MGNHREQLHGIVNDANSKAFVATLPEVVPQAPAPAPAQAPAPAPADATAGLVAAGHNNGATRMTVRLANGTEATIFF